MEKELFISTLKEKAGVDNLSVRTIEEVATMFLPQFADDEEITDESWKIPVQVMKTMSGQLRHDLSGGINDFKTKFEEDNKTAQAKAIADAVAAAKAEWEKEHPNPKSGSSKEGNEETDIDKKIANAIEKAMSGLTGEDGVIGKMNKQFTEYLDQVEKNNKAQSIAAIRDQVKSYLIGRGVKEDDYALELTLEKLVIGEKPDLNDLKANAEKDYEAIYGRMHKGEGGSPLKGGGSAGGMQPLVKSQIERAQKAAEDADNYKNSIQFAK